MGALKFIPRSALLSRNMAAKNPGATPKSKKESMKRTQYPGRSPGSEPIIGRQAATSGVRSGGVNTVNKRHEKEARAIYAWGFTQEFV